MIAAGDLQSGSVPASRESWARKVIAAGAVAAAALGLVAGILAASNQITALVGLLVFLLPVVIWRRPAVGVLGLGSAGLVIEQYRIGAGGGDVSDHIPLYTSLSEGFKLSGVYVNPAELAIAAILGVFITRAALTRRFNWPTGLVGGTYLFVLIGIGIGALHGLAAGGNSTMVVWEVRPFLYAFLLYFLALQLNPDFRTLEALYWCVVVGTGFKAIQGLILLIPILSQPGPRPDYLLSHDDAFFFGMDIVLVISLWLFAQRGRLRTVATILLPLVIVINLANSRRTAWLILGVSIVVVLVMVVIRIPEKRSLVAKFAVVAGVAAALYLPAFWNASGIIGQPARAIQSAVAPNERDRLSDSYRVAENANLALAIRASTPLGTGFGLPIDYVVPIVDLSKTDPFIKYITHDGILYVWMRMGWLGVIAWLSWIGALMITAAQLLRAPDLRLACFATFVAACLVGYGIEGYYDLGLFWFRMAFFVGLVFGLMQMARRLDETAALSPPAEIVKVA